MKIKDAEESLLKAFMEMKRLSAPSLSSLIEKFKVN